MNLDCSWAERTCVPMKWTLPHGIKVEMGGRHLNLIDRDARHQWLAKLDEDARWVLPKQSHGSVVVTEPIISDGLDNRCDGLVSTDPSVGLGVFGSDCPGVILATPDCIGIAHCGWRGIAAGIVKNLFDGVTESTVYGPSQITAFIGPAICGSCYEVDTPVLAAFDWPRSSLRFTNKDRALLDLPEAIASLLSYYGVDEILRADICTASHQSLHSHRWDGAGVAQVLAVSRDHSAR